MFQGELAKEEKWPARSSKVGRSKQVVSLRWTTQLVLGERTTEVL